MSAVQPLQIMLVEAQGLKCPEPVMLLHAAVRRSEAGGLIRLLATDPSTQRDVVNFCRFLDHELVEQSDVDGQFSYLIRKAGA